MAEKKYVLCYPQLANYNIPIQYFVNKGLQLDYIAPPRSTKRTIDLGAKYSPDFVCAPFKCHMGNYLEALEKGANVLIQTGGTCRLGYYGELQEQILRDSGYEFDIMNLTLLRHGNVFGLLKAVRKYNPKASLLTVAKPLPAVAKMIVCIDKIEDFYRKNMGFEIEDGAFDKEYKRFLSNLKKANGLGDVKRIYKESMQAFQAIPLNKPENPIRIGVVGEYFTIMDPDSNHEIEKKLAKMGAEVHRWMSLSHSVITCPDEASMGKLKHYCKYDLHKFPSSIWVDIQSKTQKYAKYNTGSSGIATITLAQNYAEAGFDGLVHVKSFGCTPEMDIIPMLHNISADYKIPTLYLSYDTQTSDTGIETRLEAFHDMISMRKEVTKS